MKALKYSCMILLSVFISCSSDDDDDNHHDEPNWVRHVLPQPVPQESSEFKWQNAKLSNPTQAEGFSLSHTLPELR
jgi:hypothetical protein